MRGRICQIQRCKQLQLAEKHGHKKVEKLPQPVVIPTPQATKHTLDSISQTPINPMIVSFDPTPLLEDDETYLRYFDSFFNSCGSDEIERSTSGQGPLLFPGINAFDSLGLTTSTSTSPVHKTDDTPVLLPNATNRTSSGNAKGLSESRSLAPPCSSLLGTYTDMDTLETDLCASGQLLSPEELKNVIQGLQKADAIASGAGQSLEPYTNGGSIGTQIGAKMPPDSESSTSDGRSETCPLLEDPAHSPTRSRDIQEPNGSSASDLSILIDGLSKYSLEERGFVEDILDTSVNSASSTSSSSRHSTSSSRSPHETSLMTRIRSDPSEDQQIGELIGTDTGINAQNSRGETALHLSVKLGKISATKTLLDQGADVHVGNNRGRGVLVAAERAQRRAKEDESLYARIAACMALTIDAGAVAAPLLVHQHHPPNVTLNQEASRTKHQDGRYHT